MNKLILFASTNALLIGALLILAGVYGAAQWYLNIEMGRIPAVIAIVMAVTVNMWVLRHKPGAASRTKNHK